MAREKTGHSIPIAWVLALMVLSCHAQEPPQDHSCTVNAAGEGVFPFGRDGQNFHTGWGFQAGGGFAVAHSKERERGVTLFITANYMYSRLGATNEALLQAKSADMMALATATSAHGSFSAVTFDPTVRFPVKARHSVYLSGGFGWFRRGVSFSGANPATLTQSAGITLDRLSANSGVFDLGGGFNFGLTRRGGPMVYAEARVYRGLTVNSGSTLVPLSVGIRW